jgi:hypothetical protein
MNLPRRKIDSWFGSVLLAVALMTTPVLVQAQDAATTPTQDAAAPAPSGDYVSRTEYDKLKAEHDAMKKEMDTLKKMVRQMANGTAPAAPAEGPNPVVPATKSTAAQTEVAAVQEQVDALKTQVKETFPGTTKLLIAGYGTAGFEARSGEDPFFDAAFNALFLFKMTDRLFFEGEMELEFEDEATNINLEVAQASYLLNDYMTIGAGRFLNPMNFFVERQHMNWVNKLPDKPLAVYDGLLPESMFGVQLRGVVPIGMTKIEYVAFVANASGLFTAPDETLGTLDFDNDANFGGHVAVGGHVGFIPIPQIEIGYGILRQKVGPRDDAVENILQSAEFNFVADSPMLKGLLALRAQWVWSHIDHLLYDFDETGDGTFSFSNNRNGGYVQFSYRPTHIDNDILKNIEGVIRYDRFNQLHTPVGFDEQRWAFGLDYWLTPSTVIKIAYEVDDKNAGARNQDAFMMQVGLGF